MPINIRQSVDEEIVELQRICLPGCKALDPNKGTWWVGYDGSIPVCFGAILPSTQWYDTLYFCRAGVLPAYRGRGLQKRLIRVRLAWAKKNGYKWAVTDTRDNVISANNLIKCGFSMFEPSKPWGFSDALYWCKKIN